MSRTKERKILKKAGEIAEARYDEVSVTKKRGRPKKEVSTSTPQEEKGENSQHILNVGSQTVPKKRGRPKKEVPTSTPQEDDESSQPTPKKRESAKKEVCTPTQPQQDESAQSVQNIGEALITKRRGGPRKFVYVPLGPFNSPREDDNN